jgi:leucyl aminopeptidase
MRTEVKLGQIDKAREDAIMVGCFEVGEKSSVPFQIQDNRLSGIVAPLLIAGDFKAKMGEAAVLYPQDEHFSKRIILAGLGKKNEVTLERVRRAYAYAGKKAKELKIKNLAVMALESEHLPVKLQPASQAMVEGIWLAQYKVDRYKTEIADQQDALQKLTILASRSNKIPQIEKGVRDGEIFSQATNFTRDLANQPSNQLTPSALGQVAEKLARENQLKCQVLSQAQIRKLGMNAFLAVAGGSEQPPKLILLEYSPPKSKNTLALVGKGITFDAGGLSLKSTENMLEMKGDMMGGAVVLATIAGCAKLQLPLRLIGIIPAAENLPSGSAQKIGDIIQSHSGKTIEVLNTDAEGRLILADALSYSRSFEPDAIIDVATLTAAIKIALGSICAGVFSNHQGLIDSMIRAGETSGERVWPMPLWDEYRQFLDSDLADIKNVGSRWGGAILAATFLKSFVGNVPWIHVDIAGVDFKDKDLDLEKDYFYWTKGATGFGARLMLQFLKDWKRITRRAQIP